MAVRWATLLACSLCLLVAPSWAQQLGSAMPATKAFRVVFRSTAACRDAGEFVWQLRRRTTRLRPAVGDEPSLVFAVQLAATPGGVRGQLWIRDPDGTTTLRDVPGGNCHEVLSAMALIGALTVDPLADSGPLAPPPPPSEPSRAPPSRKAESHITFAVGQRLTVHTAIAPGLTVGQSALAELGYETTGPIDPTLRLAGHFAQKAVDGVYGDAQFEWAAVRLSICPLRLPDTGPVGVRPCGSLDAGRLGATGYNTAEQQSAGVLFMAAGLELSFDAKLVGPLSVGAEAGLHLPFAHDTFFFRSGDLQPDEDIHTISSVGFGGGIGLQAHFF